MSSLTRMFAVLDLLEAEARPLDADAICAALGYSRPTGYRYIAELVRAGLLARLGGGAYGLGPRIIELDYAIRANDPVLAAARPIMRELVVATGGDSMLASTYGEHMVTTHHEAGPEHLILSYGRGRPMPLVRGALSKCLLAWMPRARQQRLYKTHAKDIKANRLGADWPAFLTSLAQIRREGHAVSIGELDSGQVAVAAPIEDGEGNVAAAVGVALRLARYELLDHAQLAALVMDAAHRIELALKRPVLKAAGPRAPTKKAAKSVTKKSARRAAKPSQAAEPLLQPFSGSMPPEAAAIKASGSFAPEF